MVPLELLVVGKQSTVVAEIGWNSSNKRTAATQVVEEGKRNESCIGFVLY